MAREGLRLTQFLVEPASTPSRAALMTGQCSIRSGLSLIAIEGSPYTLSGPSFKAVDEYLESVKKYPNPPAPNITQFRGGG
jgi:arylsulfatase